MCREHSDRVVEQIVATSVPQTKTGSRKNDSAVLHAEQNVDVHVPSCQGDIVETVQSMPRQRIVDVLVHERQEEIANVGHAEILVAVQLPVPAGSGFCVRRHAASGRRKPA